MSRLFGGRMVYLRRSLSNELDGYRGAATWLLVPRGKEVGNLFVVLGHTNVRVLAYECDTIGARYSEPNILKVGL